MGATTYSHRSARSPNAIAGPPLRAGLRLAPVAAPPAQTSTAITGTIASGVQGVRRSRESNAKIVPTSAAVIVASRRMASGKETVGCVTPPSTDRAKPPQSSRNTSDPASAPTNWATR
jgi:hypothetical protein